MKIVIDREACIGCGICVAKSPQGYDLDKDGKAIVVEVEAEGVVEGAEACPTKAIAVTGVVQKEAPQTCAKAAPPVSVHGARDIWVFAEQRGGELSKVS